MSVLDAPVAPQPVREAETVFMVDFTPRTSFRGEIEEGFHDVRCKAVRVEDNPFEAGKQRRAFVFEVVGREGDGELTRHTSLAAGPNLEETLRALQVGYVPGGKAQVTLADMIGTICRALIVVEPGKKDPTKEFPKIKKLSPKAGS
jgi:hypothetical protein